MASDCFNCFAAVPVGFATGLLSGAFGVGGGILATPFMRYFLGVPAHIAIGSTLAVILPTSLIAVFNYLKQGKLQLALALASGIPAILGTIIGSYLCSKINGRYLMLSLSLLMVLVGVDFLSGIGAKIRSGASQEKFKMDTKVFWVTLFIGLFIGFLSGILGIGGGFILVPAYCYLLNLSVKAAFGTSLLVVAVVALPGTFVHAWQGHVKLSLVLPMIAGALPGAWLGSFFSLRTKDKILKSVFGVILILFASYFVYREFFA